MIKVQVEVMHWEAHRWHWRLEDWGTGMVCLEHEPAEQVACPAWRTSLMMR